MKRLSLPWPSPRRRRLIRLYVTLAARYGREGDAPARPAFEVMIGAIVTQNDPAVNARAVVASLRQAGVAGTAELAALPPARLRARLRPLGTRARPPILAGQLRALAVHVERRHAGQLRAFLAQPVADLRAALLGLPGMTARTADTVLLEVAGRPVFVVDAAVRRALAARGLVAARARDAEVQALLHDNLPHDPALFRSYAALLRQDDRERGGARRRASLPSPPRRRLSISPAGGPARRAGSRRRARRG
jgi:endonuclease III-like uncharacterized protein